MSKQSTKPHPYSEMFPLVEGPPLWELSDRIKAHGLREPIVLLGGLILDGRRRELACYRAGVSPRYRAFGSRKEDGKDPLEFVYDVNYHRRHLGEGDRVLSAARYATAKVGQPKKVSAQNAPILPDAKVSAQNAPILPDASIENEPTVAEAAEKFDVPKSKVRRARKVVATGTQKLQDAVAKDEISISDAAKVADEPPEVQDAAVDAVREGKADTATEAVKKNAGGAGDDEPWVDGWGIPITKEAEAAFRDVEKFDEIIKVLRHAKKLFKELADRPGGVFLQQSFVSSSTTTGFKHKGIETAIMNIADCKPTYTVCPYAYHKHHEHGKDCTLCKGIGWIGEVSKTNGPPEELIKAAKKAHGIHS